MNSAIDVSLGMVNHLVRILIRQSIAGEQGISVERSSGSNVLLHFFLKHFTATTECTSKWFPSLWVTSTVNDARLHASVNRPHAGRIEKYASSLQTGSLNG